MIKSKYLLNLYMISLLSRVEGELILNKLCSGLISASKISGVPSELKISCNKVYTYLKNQNT